jgi:hypothetical protein
MKGFSIRGHVGIEEFWGRIEEFSGNRWGNQWGNQRENEREGMHDMNGQVTINHYFTNKFCGLPPCKPL